MERITISLDDELLAAIDLLSSKRGYTSRSEALRDIARDAVTREQFDVDGMTSCVATLAYVFEHEKRDLARRLTTGQHNHHDLSVSTLHVHLDNDNCLEVTVLKGLVDEVRALADSILTQRGVRSGNLHIMPVEEHGKTHSHD